MFDLCALSKQSLRCNYANLDCEPKFHLISAAPDEKLSLSPRWHAEMKMLNKKGQASETS